MHMHAFTSKGRKGARADLEPWGRRLGLCAHRGCRNGALLFSFVLRVGLLLGAFSLFALTHHSSPGGGLQRKVIYSRPLPFPPIWPRAWPCVGSAWAHPPAGLLPAAASLVSWIREALSFPCLSPSGTRALGPAAPCRGSVLPTCSLCGLGAFLTLRRWWCSPPSRGGCEGSVGRSR